MDTWTPSKGFACAVILVIHRDTLIALGIVQLFTLIVIVAQETNCLQIRNAISKEETSKTNTAAHLRKVHKVSSIHEDFMFKTLQSSL